MGNELVPAGKQKTAVEILREGFERLQKKDLKVVEAMNRFADLPTRHEDPDGKVVAALFAMTDEELVAAGWKSRRELRMAVYAKLPKSQWPASMQAAHERVGMRIRKQADKSANPTFNLNVINIPAPRAADPSKIIEVQPEEKPPF